jgi:tRNA nucleotidyltransferase (CCA-adding enzyme)
VTDYNFLMESRLSSEQFHVVSHFSRIAADQGLNLYLVGGAVRDLTYGQQVIHDLDFAVEGDPQKILRQLDSPRPPKAHSGELAAPVSELPPLEVESTRYHARLNAFELTLKGTRAEIAECRTETYAKLGRRPDIAPATIFEDLKRRDFSVNALAISLHPNSRGLLLDPTNGAADIEKRELRALHSRSFLEGPSRLYRLLRLGLRLGFKPEEKTKRYLDAALEERVWEHLDPDQQGRELRAILQEENPVPILRTLAERGLLAGLDKKLATARIPYDRLAKVRAVLRPFPGFDPLLLNFHSLVEKLGNAHRIRLAKKVIADRQEIKTALSLDRDARKLARALSSSRVALPSQTFTLLSKQPEILLLFLLIHYPQVKVQKRVKNYLFKYREIRARLPRAELETLGIKPGPKFEKLLERVFLAQLDGKIKTHQQVLKEMRALAGIKEPPPPPPPKPAPAKPAVALKPALPPKVAAAAASVPGSKPAKKKKSEARLAAK